MLIGILVGLLVIVFLWWLFTFLKEKKESDPINSETEEAKDESVKKAVKNEDQELVTIYKEGISYQTRNLIFLSIIFVLIIGGFIAVKFIYKNKNNELSAEYEKKEKKLNDLKQQISEKDSLEIQLARKKEEVLLTNKILLKNDNPAKSLDYLLDVNRRFSNSFNFDFRKENSGNIADKNVMFNTYMLSGETYYSNFFKFLSHIEREPAFYKVENLNIQGLSAQDKGKISFNLVLKAFYIKDGIDISEINYSGIITRKIKYNPFFSRFHEPIIPEDTKEFNKLLNVNNAKLIAISNNNAYIRNNSTGKLLTLRKGDKVQFGYLSKINWNEQKVYFNIYRYGYKETFVLDLNEKDLNE